MKLILSSPVSALHVVAALLALGVGTAVLLTDKGTRRHRRLGYAYVGLMLVVLSTAFGIYRLFGRFGVVHAGAVVAWLALLVGVGAAFWKRPAPYWQLIHYVGMGASVTGLYATFVVESTYRLVPAPYFWWATLGPSAVVFAVGGWLLWRGWGAATTFGANATTSGRPATTLPRSKPRAQTATGALMAGQGL